MAKWTDNEEGPECYCGWPTRIKVSKDGVGIMCFGHTSAAGAWFKLPDEKPDDWPTPAQLAEIGMRALTHEEPEEGYMCICCDCCDKRSKEAEEEDKDETGPTER
jgi:hypothetical protein